MKTLTIITIIFFALAFAFVLRWFVKEWIKEHKTTPDDLLHDLNFKIMYSEVNDHSELYLINYIKEFRKRPDIDQKRLSELDIKFRQRFQDLHPIDEFSPENLDDKL